MADSHKPGTVRRFIAGAVCPACGLVDKIYVETDGKTVTRKCNRCDFTESLDPDGGDQMPAGDWQPVRFRD